MNIGKKLGMEPCLNTGSDLPEKRGTKSKEAAWHKVRAYRQVGEEVTETTMRSLDTSTIAQNIDKKIM